VTTSKKLKKKKGEKRAERYQREIRAGERYREFLNNAAKMVSAFPIWLRGPNP
jgi:hypothetical protein